MKALILKEYNNLVYEDFPKPTYMINEVLIQVKACGICGSDVQGLDGSTGRRIPPIIMGHEASGVIAEVGEAVKGWKEGERVTFDSTIYPLNDWYTLKGYYNLSDNRRVLGVSCRDYRLHGALAEYVSVPQQNLYRIPEKVTFNQAAMVEPAAVALHAIELTPIKMNDTALVVGAGIIGLFVIQFLRITGCGIIVAADINRNKLEMAKKLGADVTLHPQDDNIRDLLLGLTEGRGADVAFEVVGISSTIKTAVESLRKGGTLTLVGNVSPTVELPLQAVVTRQIRLQGSCAICGEYPEVLVMIEKGLLNVDELLSATAPLAEGASWFKRLYNKEPGLMKVILNP